MLKFVVRDVEEFSGGLGDMPQGAGGKVESPRPKVP